MQVEVKEICNEKLAWSHEERPGGENLVGGGQNEARKTGAGVRGNLERVGRK